MNIEQMQYIVEVAKTKSLIAASNNLYITQSALSQSISNLEEELGIKIFTRSRHGTLPTAKGRFVIKKADEILIKLREIKETTQEFSDILNSELRIFSIPIGITLIVNAITRFKKEYSDTKFQITQRSSQEILQDLRKKKADIGLIAIQKNQLTQLHEFTVEPFLEGKMVVGVGKKSPLANKKSVSSKDLLKQSFILYEEKYIQKFTKEFVDKFGEINIMFTSNNAMAILTALQENLAVTFGYDLSFHTASELIEGELIPIEISDFEYEPVIFCWVQLKKTEKRLVSQKFLKCFMNDF